MIRRSTEKENTRGHQPTESNHTSLDTHQNKQATTKLHMSHHQMSELHTKTLKNRTRIR